MKIRYPAEWETQASTWLSWPHNPQNWQNRRDEVEEFYGQLIGWITRFQPVNLLVSPERMVPDLFLKEWQKSMYPVFLHSVPNNDIWIRDYGPFFLQGAEGGFQVQFRFNAWGAKFPPWDDDARVPQHTARILSHRLLSFAPILEGGAMEFNGAGIGMTTLDCLVGPERNASEQLPQILNLLRQVFGLEDLIILPQGLHGDHTDGHIDNVARFVGPRRIVMAKECNPQSPNYPVLEAIRHQLHSWMRAQPEKDWILDELQLPEQRQVGDEILPASYMNFIYANGAVLVPLYGSSQDQVALDYFQSVYPDRVVEGMDCRFIIAEGGSLHCMSKQQPLC